MAARRQVRLAYQALACLVLLLAGAAPSFGSLSPRASARLSRPLRSALLQVSSASELELKHKDVNFQDFQSDPIQHLVAGGAVDYTTAAKFQARACGDGDKVCGLANQVQQQLYQQQYGKCGAQDQKFMLCYLIRPGSFASTFQHAVWCLNMAFATGRTAVFVSEPNKFNKAKDCPVDSLLNKWECYFQPATSCELPDGDRGQRKPFSQQEQAQIVYINAEHMKADDAYKQWAPESVKSDLAAAGVDAGAWFKGQLASFLFRFNRAMSTRYKTVKKSIGFSTPIIGVHVVANSGIPLEKYMEKVDAFAAEYTKQKPAGKKAKPMKLFISTNDQKVILEANQKWGAKYSLVSHAQAVQPSESESHTYERVSRGLFDVTMLAECNYFVGDLSSEHDRWVHELLFNKHGAQTPKVVASVNGQWAFEV